MFVNICVCIYIYIYKYIYIYIYIYIYLYAYIYLFIHFCVLRDIFSLEMITAFPQDLGADDIEDFCVLAKYYSTRTPQSFRKVCRRLSLRQFADLAL